jgi:hypothetical protein
MSTLDRDLFADYPKTMNTYKVEVGVALSRPPRLDATIYYVLLSETGRSAELTALIMASSHPRVVMPVCSTVTDWTE